MIKAITPQKKKKKKKKKPDHLTNFPDPKKNFSDIT